tara:strand:+ start:770 stop:1783 length:1014 start_codon:yes stop_codon:yes gene_type:complete
MEQLLIERLQNFTLDRKVLSIDTDDRDKSRWPNANEFEVSTPQVYNNVESLRLINIQTPNQLYNISENLQNNKLIITNGNNRQLITIDDGYYNPTQICESIQTQVNKNFTSIGNDFFVHYNTVSQKPHFMSETKDFSLIFQDDTIIYSSSSNCISKVYEQHSNWGLGSILGFNNKNFVSSTPQTNSNSSEIYFYHNNISLLPSASGVIIPPDKLNLDFNQFIYLEIDKYNTSDEIKPYINNRLNNSNTGLVNSYFAKIPIRFRSNGINQSLSCKEDFMDSLSYYQPTIEKISKFKIKLRYHNGILVDLGNYNISFTLEINQIRNEMKNYNVRKPFKL